MSEHATTLEVLPAKCDARYPAEGQSGVILALPQAS